MNSRIILAAIDGTGSTSWMRPDGANSHIHRFYRDLQTHGGDAKYWAGPGTAGMETAGIIDEVFEWVVARMERFILETHCRQEDLKICIVGHSRGATAAICIANRLCDSSVRIAISPSLRTPIQVQFVGLYDTVNRTLDVSPDTAMPNVSFCSHAVRKNISVFSSRGSRGSFGTVDVTRGKHKKFNTAHGGIGGDPGFFTRLDKNFADFYCNALEVILTQPEINTIYGMVPTRIGLQPRYRALTGKEAETRRKELALYVLETKAADAYIRAGASAAGLTFTGASPHMPYSVSEAPYWPRLSKLIAGF